jgi:hypothetical protein
MRRKAAFHTGNSHPDSLMARLARLEGGQQPTIKTRPQMMQRYFGLGLLGSGLLGVAAIVALPHIAPEYAPERVMAASSATFPAPLWPTSTTRETTVARPPALPPRSRTAQAAAEPPGPPPPLSMNLTRSGQGMSPFPLQVTGVPDPDNARVIVGDLPKTARLSSGERRDEHTWALKIADLKGLQVNFAESTPEVFDITIEVASTSGTQLVKTSARVRLMSDGAPAARRRLPSSIEDLLRESKAKNLAPAAHAAVDTPFRTKVSGPSAAAAPTHPAEPPAAAVDAAPKVAQTERKALPQGLSALGGPLDRPEAENRQVWWKLPTSTWTPFGDARGQ